MFVARWWQFFSGTDRSDSRPRRRSRPSGRRHHKLKLTADALEDRQLLAPLVTVHGGPILTNVQVYTVYWGWNMAAKVPGMRGGVTYGDLANMIDNFFQDITGSGYMSDLAQYGAGKGTWEKQDMVAGPVAARSPPMTSRPCSTARWERVIRSPHSPAISFISSIFRRVRVPR